MESSRQDLLNDMAERGSIFKNNQNTNPLFFETKLCSATSMESTRQDLLNDMAERRSILKINKIRIARFIFPPKQGKNYLKPVFPF